MTYWHCVLSVVVGVLMGHELATKRRTRVILGDAFGLVCFFAFWHLIENIAPIAKDATEGYSTPDPLGQQFEFKGSHVTRSEEPRAITDNCVRENFVVTTCN